MTETHLSDAEWKVMNAVWAAHPTNARRVLEAVATDTRWAYSTVKTMLDRLVDKGALTARIEGITTIYAPAITQEMAQRSAAQDLAAKAFGGGVDSMMHFLMQRERLSAAERERLRRLLDEEGASG